MERGLLSDPQLAKDYDGVVWMYLFQDFTHSDADRAAERIAIRFGISSWPQHFLVDPTTLAKVGDTGRNLESFRAAVTKAEVAAGAPKPSVEELAALDELAASLEANADVATAKKHLLHEDRVVAFRAMQTLAKQAPEELVAEAGRLLAVPNDQIRGATCDALSALGDGAARDALHALVRSPAHSENPNVLRIRATKALARCGDASSLAVVAPFAASGEYRNGLTNTAIQTVVAIAERDAKATTEAVAILARAYPPLPTGTEAGREQRMCEALAKNVHEALAKLARKQVPFPEKYDDETRAKLMRSWQ
ncbi:MAG: HEAT repeat domain-containing protein [Planctomycetes bacterium]|nr:HEAT repeat domain-containing protein [Planctomycetota bacterium]